jgi:hypothetical protein
MKGSNRYGDPGTARGLQSVRPSRTGSRSLGRYASA